MSGMEFKVFDLLQIDLESRDGLNLRCIAGKNGLDNIIETKNINRPGLALGGYFEKFASNRIQVFGMGEYTFLEQCRYEDEIDKVKTIMNYKIPCVLFSNDNVPPEFFLKLGDEKKTPILVSDKASDYLVARLFYILSDVFAKRKRIHATLVEVFGIGILLKGNAELNKSELALELIQRGHRLVADDTVDLKVEQENTINGQASSVIRHHMEIQGIGIIDVKSLFGVGAIRDVKNVQLVIELETYNPKNEYDSIGLEEKYIDILDLKIPYLLLPVKQGRNIANLVEIAAMNQRLKMLGVNSAKEFNKNLTKYLETEEIKRTFFKF